MWARRSLGCLPHPLPSLTADVLFLPLLFTCLLFYLWRFSILEGKVYLSTIGSVPEGQEGQGVANRRFFLGICPPKREASGLTILRSGSLG